MKNKKPTTDTVLSQTRQRAIQILSALVLLLGAYLLWLSVAGGAAIGCGPDSGCNEVLKSRWSKWFGIPVSVPALLLYAGVFFLSFRLREAGSRERVRQAWGFLLPAAAMILGAAIWFAAVQLFILKSICVYCMTAHGIGGVLAVLLFRSAPRPGSGEGSIVSPGEMRRAFLLAAVGVAVLAAGQALQPLKTYQIASAPPAPNAVPQPPALTNPPAPTTGSVAAASVPAPPAAAPAQAAKRVLKLHGGATEIDLADVPLWGSQDAEHVMVSLFDYTCHHCRSMHFPLSRVQKTLAGKLSIVSLPMPLDENCNPLITKTPAAHVNACAYARLGLAVWRADRGKMAEFDDWLFKPEHPPSIEEAREQASKLVGEVALASAESDPWVSRQLQRDIDIYLQTYRHHRKGAMPQLYIGTNVVFGPISSEPFFRLLNQSYGIVEKPTGP